MIGGINFFDFHNRLIPCVCAFCADNDSSLLSVIILLLRIVNKQAL